tara:strand:+ start:1042 stop:1803 length:762 start_codon:yes stop_codon:yes gene_type:complete
MSWYSSDFSHRAAISVDNHGGSNPCDIEVVIPTDWPEFWDVVLSSGNDVYVTRDDGINTVTFKLDSWNHTAKTGNIHIDNFQAASTAAALTLWVYWGNSSASSAQSAFTVSSPKTGHIETHTPGSGSSPVISCRPETPGATNPRSEISKASTEDIFIWWDLSKVLARRRVPYQNRRLLEEVQNVRYLVQQQGSTVSAMSDNTSIRQVGNFIRTTIKGGSSGSNAVAILTVVTDAGRVLDFRCTIRVNDVTEPT